MSLQQLVQHTQLRDCPDRSLYKHYRVPVKARKAEFIGLGSHQGQINLFMHRGYHPLEMGGVPVTPKAILTQGLALQSGKDLGNNKGRKKTGERKESK